MGMENIIMPIVEGYMKANLPTTIQTEKVSWFGQITLDMKEVLLLIKCTEVVPNNMVTEIDMSVCSKMINIMELASGIVQLTKQKDKANGQMVKE